jgi:hypothetical protein
LHYQNRRNLKKQNGNENEIDEDEKYEKNEEHEKNEKCNEKEHEKEIRGSKW